MARNNDRWSALSMKDRADLIKLYVGNGITNIKDIRNHYNKFETGGYTEELEPSVVVDYTKGQEEVNNAKQFVENYYTSEAYRKRAKSFGLSEKNPLKRTFGIFPRKMVGREDISTNESYKVFFPIIGLQPSKNPMYPDLLDDVGNSATHEYTHYNKLYNTKRGGDKNFTSPYYGMNYKKVPKEYYDILQPVTVNNLHDWELNENYSDLMGLRYLMQKHNIFDSMNPNDRFDESDYEYLIKDERYENDRFLKNHTKEQVIKAINDVAQSVNYKTQENVTAFGGKINKFTTGGPVKTFDVNNPISPTQYWEDFITENSIPFSMVPEAAIDENELIKRQAWAESAGNDRAGSNKGAKGRYQIMPDTLSEYQKVTGDIGDIYDPIYNRRVRDWEFNRYKNSDQVNRGEPTDSVKMGRRLAIYNYGYGNVKKALNKADSLGTDIDTSFDWLHFLPQETQDYVNFILRNKDTGSHRTNSAYKNRKK